MGLPIGVDFPIIEMFKLALHGQPLVILQKGRPFELDELTEWMKDTIFTLTIAQCDTFSLIILMEGGEGFCELLSPWP